MSSNNIRLFAVCMLAAFVISGFLAPYGLLVGPIANAFATQAGVIGSLFSFFTGGIFVGWTFAIPWIRTLTFVAGFACQAAIVLQLV